MPSRKRKLDSLNTDTKDSGPYKCHLCGQCFYRGCGLASHLRRHAPVTFDCEYCEYKCKHKYAYDRHLLQCHPEEPGPMTMIKQEIIEDDMPMPVLESQVMDMPMPVLDPQIDVDISSDCMELKLKDTSDLIYMCPVCPIQFDNQPRAAFHILSHRVKMHQAPRTTKLFSKKIGQKLGGYYMGSLAFLNWKMRVNGQTIDERRATIWRFLEENFGYSIFENLKNEDDKDVQIRTQSISFGQLFKRRLTMKCGTTFGQQIIFNSSHYYLCRKCPYVTWNVSSLWRHFRHHAQRSYQSWTCLMCTYSSSNRFKVDLHVRLHKDISETDHEFGNWIRYERRANKSDFNKTFNKKKTTEIHNCTIYNDQASTSSQAVGSGKIAVLRDREIAAPTLQSFSPTLFLPGPNLVDIAPFDCSGIVTYKSINPLPNVKKERETTQSAVKLSQVSSKPKRTSSAKTANEDSKKLYKLPKESKFYRADTPEDNRFAFRELSDDSTLSSDSHEDMFKPLSLALDEPKYEDYLYMKPESPFFLKQKHPLEALELFRLAKEEYEVLSARPKLPSYGLRTPYEDLHPLAKAQYGKNNPVEYYMKEMEIEQSRQCADCPYKNSDLNRFRIHRDRHFLNGSHKCVECSYSSYDFQCVEEHTFVDHYLSDVRLVEGLPSSDSEGDEYTPSPQERQKKKSVKRGKRRW